MSRYVRVPATAVRSLDEVAAGLLHLGLPMQRGRRPVMLEGSIECSGEPVDLRLPSGTLGSVEDFGFVTSEGGPVLVCGEYDRELLEQTLLAPLLRAVTELRVRHAAAEAGLQIEQTTEVDGQRRIVLRRG